MGNRIDSDRNRFREIIKGKVRKNFKDLIGHEKMIGQQGAKKISIPLDYINLPIFSFGPRNGGTSQGSGDDGSPVNGKPGKGKPGKGAGSEGEGDGSLGTEFTVSELAEVLREHLHLENLEDRGTASVEKEKNKYNKIVNIGNESLRHGKRTWKQAIIRSVSSGVYDPNDPTTITVEKQDKRYRASSYVPEPAINATLIFISDCSGSMGEKERHLVKATAFWIDLLLRDQYAKLDVLWMIFDTKARLVDKDAFFRVNSGGGTAVSSAMKLTKELLETKYTRAATNSYVYVFSDGDSSGDDEECVRLLNDGILPIANKVCYGQVARDGGFIKTMTENFDNHPKAASALIEDENGIMPAIKSFFTPKK